jgi:hypothetical protein
MLQVAVGVPVTSTIRGPNPECPIISVTLPLFGEYGGQTTVCPISSPLVCAWLNRSGNALAGASRGAAGGGPGTQKINLSPFNTFSVDSGSISYADCESWEEGRRMLFH